jgi:hypothetical protein
MNINSEENILKDLLDLNIESRWRLDKLKISLENLRKENEELRYKNAKLEEKCVEYLRNNRYLDKKVYGDTVNFEGVSFHINDSEKAKAQPSPAASPPPLSRFPKPSRLPPTLTLSDQFLPKINANQLLKN